MNNNYFLGLMGLFLILFTIDLSAQVQLDVEGEAIITSSSSEPTLTIQNDTKADLLLKRGAATGSLQLNSGGGALGLTGSNGGDNIIQLRTYGTSYFNGGKFGIGIATPEEKLQVVGANDVVRIRVENTSDLNATLRAKTPASDYGWYADGDENIFKLFDFNAGIGGEDRMSILGNGNVGIGTITPSQKLHVIGNVEATSFIGDGSQLTNLPKQWTESGNNIRRTTGNVSIGTSTTGHRLTVQSTNAETMRLLGPGPNDRGARLNFGDDVFVYIGEDEEDKLTIRADEGIVFLDNVTVNEQLFVETGAEINGSFEGVTLNGNSGGIDINGETGGVAINGNNGGVDINGNGGGIRMDDHVGVGRNIDGFYEVAVQGGHHGLYINVDNNNNTALQVNHGQARKPGGGVWQNISDRRLKKDIIDFNDGLEELEAIRPVKYRYNGLNDLPTEMEYVGVIAQELREVAPYMVFERDTIENSNEKYLSIDGSAFTYMLINAVQELSEKNKATSKANEALLNKVNQLEDQLATIQNLDALLAKANALEAKLAAFEQLEQKIKILEDDVDFCCQSQGNLDVKAENRTAITLEETAHLEQNTPNPFNGETTIQYYLPKWAYDAQLQITDFNGKVLKVENNLTTGHGTISLAAEALPSGTYSYSLLVDGKIVDTKRMVLVK